MRLTIEGRKRVFTIAVEPVAPDEPEPIHPEGDVFASTERRKSFDYEDARPIGFASSKDGK